MPEYFFKWSKYNKKIILREIKASKQSRKDTRSYEDDVKAILFRADGHNIANFVSRSRLLNKILRIYIYVAMHVRHKVDEGAPYCNAVSCSVDSLQTLTQRGEIPGLPSH